MQIIKLHYLHELSLFCRPDQVDRPHSIPPLVQSYIALDGSLVVMSHMVGDHMKLLITQLPSSLQ